jgi:MFS superfamily sulfate permease-like transporter
MEITEHIALFFHVIGFVALFGVSMMQIRARVRTVKSGMLHGALIQLVSGLILVAIKVSEINHFAATAKLVIICIILGILFYYRRNTERIIPALPFFAIVALTLVEVLIALAWID